MCGRSPLPYPARETVKGSYLLKMFRTTDPKMLGIMYLTTSFVFFLVGGVMALLMRTELARRGCSSSPRSSTTSCSPCTARSCCCCTRPRSVRVRQLHPAAADRCPGRRLPAAERLLLLAVPVRRADRAGRLPHPGRRGRLRLVRLRAADQTSTTRPASAPTCGSSAWPSPASAPSSARVNMVTTVIYTARARHDDVPDADLHLEHPGHQHC